jgi:hypothetical protein
MGREEYAEGIMDVFGGKSVAREPITKYVIDYKD